MVGDFPSGPFVPLNPDRYMTTGNRGATGTDCRNVSALKPS